MIEKGGIIMRCPNCSFLNPDDAEECKICGHELKPKSNNSRHNDDNISQTLNAIFGQSNDSTPAPSDATEKKLDPRFEEYLDIPSEKDTEENDLEADQWLEALQRDIQNADAEIQALRSSKNSQDPKKQEDKSPALGDSPDASLNEVPYAALNQTIGEAENITPVTGRDINTPTAHPIDSEASEPVKNTPEPKVNPTPEPESSTPSGHEAKSTDNQQVPYEGLSETVASPDNLSSTPLHNPVGLDPLTEEPESELGPEEDYFDSKAEEDIEESININLTQHPINETTGRDDYRDGSYDYADGLIDEQDYEGDDKPNRSRQHIIILAAVLAIILIILFIKSLTQSPETTEPLAPGSNGEQLIDVTPPISTLDDIYSFVDTFYSKLSDYVNTGTLGVTSLFTNSQEALSQLSDYREAGNIIAYDYEPFDDLDVSSDPLTLTVTANITRIVNDVETPIKSNWTFVLDRSSGQYMISSLKIEPLNNNNDFSDSQSGNNNSSDASDNTSNNNGNQNTADPTPNTTPEQIKPEGFINSGSFSGGVIADGQDVANIRYGRHEAFERLVFDLYKWTGYNSGDAPSETVDEACHFDATLSEDGQTITLIFSGARAGSAAIPNLTGSTSIDTIAIFYPSDDSSVGVTIKLKSPSAFKAFALKSPGKVVVDVMPR